MSKPKALQEVENLILLGQEVEKALQNKDKDIRITNIHGDAWLVADGQPSNEFVVYQHKKYSRNSKELIRTTNCSEALEILLNT